MPLPTTLECPHCGKSTKTAKAIPSNVRIRCPLCGGVFQILPAEGSRIETFSVVSEEVGPSKALPPRAPAATESGPKTLTLGGTPVPFISARKSIALVLLGIILSSGYFFIRWYTDQVRLLTKSVDKTAAERSLNVREITERMKRSEAEAKLKNPTNSIPAHAPNRPTRTSAPSTEQIGDMVVGVAAGHLAIPDGSSGGECLYLTLQITNLGTKPISHLSWSEPELHVTLRDQNRQYNQFKSHGQGAMVINPGLTVSDVLVFEAASIFVVLELDLPVPDKDEPFRFRIPRGFVQRLAPQSTQLSSRQEAKGPVTAVPVQTKNPEQGRQLETYDPEQDRPLCDRITSEYRAGIKKIARRAMGMATDRARKFRQTEPERFLGTLAKKYQLREEQIRRIVDAQ